MFFGMPNAIFHAFAHEFGGGGRLGLIFFFSSRRRHTRSDRDWSSDVCSSDLVCARFCWTGKRVNNYHPVANSSIESECSTMMPSHHAAPATFAGIWTGSATDFRHAFRLLWKSKRITATTLVTLALCIGATTAIFSSVYSLMLKPLPFQEPERMVELYSSAAKAGLHHMPANVPFYLDYSQNAKSYEQLAATPVQ